MIPSPRIRFVLAFAAALSLLVSCDSGSSANSSTPSLADTVATPAGSVAAPVFSPPGGNYSTAQTVTITSSTSGAILYYTTDGTTPTSSSTKYASPVTVNASETLNAIAVKIGMMTSTVGSAAYTIQAGSQTTNTVTWGGQTYKTVKIGTQTWMAENLNIAVDSSWCYENSADSCAKYGRLYQWATMMGLDASYNTKLWNGTLPRQGICPSGWHIPSQDEWDSLKFFVGRFTVGDELRSRAWGGSDGVGFNALPSGSRYSYGVFSSAGKNAYLWSSSETDSANVWYRFLSSDYDNLDHHYLKRSGSSVRCLKDAS